MAMTTATEHGCSHVLPDGGEVIRIFDEEIVVKVHGDQSAGAYAVFTGSVAPGGGPPLHAHPGSETLFVLSGEFLITQRDAGGVSTFRAGPGAVVHAPAGAPHRFENVSTTRSTMLFVGAPELVDFVRELGAAFPPGAEPDMEKMLAINEKYGVETFHGGEGSRPEPPKDGATSARARALAWRFEQAHDALVATIEACTPDQWRARCADTRWTVAVQAHHVAENEAAIASLVRDAAAGRPRPSTPTETLDAINARHAAQFADVTIEETLTLMRRHGPAAARTYRGLSDEQLALAATPSANGPAPTVAQLIEHLAIGEIARHGEHIRRAIGV